MSSSKHFKKMNKEELNGYIIRLISRELNISDSVISIENIEYHDNDETMVVSFSIEFGHKVFYVDYFYREIDEYIDFYTNIKKKMKITDTNIPMTMMKQW